LPAGQEFVIRNLNSMVNSRQRVQLFSLVILLITSSGIFLPLEVALNRIWRFDKNRSYLGIRWYRSDSPSHAERWR